MATFFKRSEVWVVDFFHDGRARRWFTALPAGTDGQAGMQARLQDLYGARVSQVVARPATAQEELAYVRGDLPRNVYCPNGKEPLGEPVPPRDKP